MLIKRSDALSLEKLFNNIKDKKFDIDLQYKIIKLHKSLKEEKEIYQEQMEINCKPFFESDDKGNTIYSPDGGVKIKLDCIDKCNKVIAILNNCQVQVPDIYFSLDELKKLDLTLDELSAFEPFIK